MDSAQSGYASLQFSTEQLSERDRIPFSREFFGRKIVHLDIEPERDQPFRMATALQAMPGLCLHYSSVTPVRLRRDPKTASDGDSQYALIINLSGSSRALIGREELSCGPGDALLVSHREPATMTHGDNVVLGLVLPRHALLPLVPDLDGTTMKRIPAASEALRLLVGYVDLVRPHLSLAAGALRHLMVTHIQDLAALAIGASRDGEMLARNRGLRAARLAAIKSDIIANLSSPELSAAAVADRQRVSPRYVHMLFEGEGTTFSAHVLELRLALARRLLADPRHRTQTVSAIAFAVGFGDLSYFNRTFRRRFGATPSDVRSAAS